MGELIVAMQRCCHRDNITVLVLPGESLRRGGTVYYSHLLVRVRRVR